MADTEKVAKIKTLMEEIKQLSAELSEDELEQIAGGYLFGPAGGSAPPRPEKDTISPSDYSIAAGIQNIL
jgi:bacteriocin-like protein